MSDLPADVPADALAARVNADLLVSAAAVEKAIDQVAIKLKIALFAENPILICVLNGGLPYTAALLKRLEMPLELTYVHAGRYGKSLRGSEIEFHAKPAMALSGRHVVFVDDILDQGHTLAALCAWASEEGATAVTTTVLVDKQIKATRPIVADFAALECPDRYLFGCGMDYRGYWRNLPEIYAISAALQAQATD